MYKDLYHLAQDPFEITPDPYFFFPTQPHNEALAVLYHGVRSQKGFVLVTGEVGTGKTLLLRCLLDVLNRDQVAFSYIFNPRLTPVEFLQYLMGDFGLSHEGKSKAEMLLELNKFLVSRHAQGLSTVLILDEGQLLSLDLLEEIRLLTNLETAKKKLLQIILVGQTELDRKINLPEMRQLRQRIALRCRLRPLTESETRAYIQLRLELAGANSKASSIFSQAAMRAIFRYSRGIPRLINTLCENALVTTYARQVEAVTPEIVAGIANDFLMETEEQQSIESLPVGNTQPAPSEIPQLIDHWDSAHTVQDRRAQRAGEAKS
jgi:general secretion pathway protein A